MIGEEAMPLPVDEREAANQLALEWDNAGKGISETQIASSNVADIPGWEGLTKDAYSNEAESLKRHTQDLSEKFPVIKQALQDWATALEEPIAITIPGLWASYDAANAKYTQDCQTFETEMATVKAEGNPYSTYEKNEGYRIIDEARQTVQSGILKQYAEVLVTLNAAAQAAAKKIQEQVDLVVDPEVVAKGRNAIGASLFNDMPLVDGQAEWEYAQQMAPAIAAAMRNPNLTEQDLKRFYDEYADLLEDPFYAYAVAELINPDEMTMFAFRASTIMGADSDMVEDVLQSLGTALVLSTGGMNLQGPMADKQRSFELVRNALRTGDGKSINELTESQLEAFKAAGNKEYNVAEMFSSNAWESVEGYEVLSQLLGSAAKENPNLSLGPGFFESPNDQISVATDIVNWDNERKEWAIHPAERWKHRLFAGENGYLRDETICDPLHSMYLLMDQPDCLDTLVNKDPSLLTDTQRALLEMNANRMDGIRDFLNSETSFAVDIGGKAEGPKNMTQYLTGWRQGSMAHDYFGFQDGGEAFGEVIQQVSAPTEFGPAPDPANYGGEYTQAYIDAKEAWEIRRDRDYEATEVAMNFIHGYQDGLDMDYGNLDKHNGQDVFGYNNQNLRSWTGVILAPHVEDIALSLNSPNPVFGVYTDNYANDNYFKFTDGFADKLRGTNGLFVDLGFDNPQIENGYYVGGRAPAIDNLLTAAKSGYEEALLEAQRIGFPINEVTSDWAAMTRTLFSAPAEASVEALKAMDARNERWQGLIEAGIGAVPFSDIIDSKAVNWAIGQGQSNGVTPALEAFLPTDNAAGAQTQVVERGNMAEIYMSDALVNSVAVAVGPDGQPVIDIEQATDFCNSQESAETHFVKDGKIMPPTEMTPKQLGNLRTFLEHISKKGGGKSYTEELSHVKIMLNMEDIETNESRKAEY